MIDMAKHPCFNESAKGRFGRVHIPIAPKCNIQCLFCDRKYDCINESRPGVTSSVLTPPQALKYLDKVCSERQDISVVGIAGPGDAFANPEETMETLRLIRANYPEMILCLSSNGLNIAPYIQELAKLEVSHVTITINAVDPEIGKEIYAWIRHDKQVMRGIKAAAYILEKQLEAVKKLKEHGITVKVNSILISGVNEDHITDIAQKVSELGADMHNVIPLCPVAGTKFEDTPAPDKKTISRVRKESEKYMPQMRHCTRCRADACGLLCEGTSSKTIDFLKEAAAKKLVPTQERPYVAVATNEGMLVNRHLGEADELWIFKKENDSFECIGVRHTPERGGGDSRWEKLAKTLDDCAAVLVSGVGESPKKVLNSNGLKVFEMEGLIEEGLDAFYCGREIKAPVRNFKCGGACMGSGMGCSA